MMTNNRRFVFDTNVLISAFLTKSPSTGASILASLEQAHTPPDSPLEHDILAQPPEDFAAKIAEIKQRGDRSQSVIRRGSTGQDLLKFAGTWHGDDLEEYLAFLDATRSKAKANAMYFCYPALASSDFLGF